MSKRTGVFLHTQTAYLLRTDMAEPKKSMNANRAKGVHRKKRIPLRHLAIEQLIIIN